MNRRTAAIAGRNYDALVALRNRMTPEDLAWNTINARVEEAHQAMKGMPDDMITLGELHTAYRCVVDHAPAGTRLVGSSIQSSEVRGGNALRRLEDEGLVTTNAHGEWIPTTDNLTPEEANGVFDAKFPGLSTLNKRPTGKQPTHRAQRAQPNKEKATMAIEYTKDSSKATGTKFEQVAKMIDALRKSEDPIGFNELCEKVGAKYPQDVQAAMFALDVIGAVERYTFVEENSTRSRIAYKWMGDGNGEATPRPTKSTSTASKPRSSRSKKATETPAEEATPAAA